MIATKTSLRSELLGKLMAADVDANCGHSVRPHSPLELGGLVELDGKTFCPICAERYEGRKLLDIGGFLAQLYRADGKSPLLAKTKAGVPLKCYVTSRLTRHMAWGKASQRYHLILMAAGRNFYGHTAGRYQEGWVWFKPYKVSARAQRYVGNQWTYEEIDKHLGRAFGREIAVYTRACRSRGPRGEPYFSVTYGSRRQEVAQVYRDHVVLINPFSNQNIGVLRRYNMLVGPLGAQVAFWTRSRRWSVRDAEGHKVPWYDGIAIDSQGRVA